VWQCSLNCSLHRQQTSNIICDRWKVEKSPVRKLTNCSSLRYSYFQYSSKSWKKSLTVVLSLSSLSLYLTYLFRTSRSNSLLFLTLLLSALLFHSLSFSDCLLLTFRLAFYFLAPIHREVGLFNYWPFFRSQSYQTCFNC